MQAQGSVVGFAVNAAPLYFQNGGVPTPLGLLWGAWTNEMPSPPQNTFGHPVSSNGLSSMTVCLNISRARRPNRISPLLAQEAVFSLELLVASRPKRDTEADIR